MAQQRSLGVQTSLVPKRFRSKFRSRFRSKVCRFRAGFGGGFRASSGAGFQSKCGGGSGAGSGGGSRFRRRFWSFMSRFGSFADTKSLRCCHADTLMIRVVRHADIPLWCRADMFSCWRAGMGHAHMLRCCHAEMPKSGHAVVLTCWQTPEWVLTYCHVGMLARHAFEDCIVWPKTWHLLVNLRWCRCLVGGF